ncbi:hypothetical protein BJ912DRAFT_1019043 [Pholiota molesta]|nr:hypothetical protein BJ912DRAFT_1019043 [Pholiota molesta]
MVFDPESATHLKPWLVRTLEPICDAEPGALADYILALLKHNVPENEMRKELAVQLDEFLEKECSSFIDTLFTVIRTKSYLPYQAVQENPNPLDALLTPTSTSPDRTRKRSTTDDERDGRPPAKGPRLNTDGQFSRYGNVGNGADGRMGPHSSGGWTRPPFRDGTMGMGMGMGMGPYAGPMSGMGMGGMGMMNGRRPQGYQPPDQKRGICRDYHNSGYCARGAMCKYSHGDDAFMQGAAYDPHESRMDMRPMGGRQHQRAPLLPRSSYAPINASGELPVIQDLTPAIPPDIPPAESQSQGDVDMQQPGPRPQVPPPNMPPQTTNGYPPMHGNMNGNAYQPGPAMEVDHMHMPGMRPPTLGRGQFRGGRGGGGRGRGTFGGEVHNFRPEKRNDKTLVVEKIPEDKLSLESVNSWFKRFGTVTNVAIDANNAKALVSFSGHEEAHAAWKSEDAVFWHRPMEGHGQVGARMLAASATAVANMGGSSESTPPQSAAVSSTSTPAPTATASTPASRKPSVTPGPSSSAASALAAKSQLLEQTLAEQKKLMAALDTASPEEKKEIMAQFRKLDEEMTKLKASSPTPAPTAKVAGKKPADGLTEHERKERERLDKELEMHGGEKLGESAEDLQAKLQRLKEEVGPSIRILGYPRGGFMRGGPPRASMKLDNRPKKLLVKGVREDGSQALKDWYEVRIGKGLNIPIVGSVQLSWYTGTASTTTPSQSTKASTSSDVPQESHSTQNGADSYSARTPEVQTSHLQEEEIIASGWGGGDDDDGMGLL